tara:strand:+ start:1515 stop:7871 length:6357 start_codon:yes stop_codon:yes gene_type:complete
MYSSKYIIVCGAKMFQIHWLFVRSVVVFLFFFSSLLKSFQDESKESLYFNKDIFIYPYSQFSVYPFPEFINSSIFFEFNNQLKNNILNPNFEIIDKWIDFSDDGNSIIFYESVNGKYEKIPLQMSINYYFDQKLKINRINNFKKINDIDSNEISQTVTGDGLELVAIDTRLGRASLTVNGNVNLSGKLVFQDQELTRSNFRESQTTHFEFDETQQVIVQGKVGDRINVDLNYNSERDFDFENNIKINYKGTEDEIFQTLEAGNISLSLPSTQFVTFSGQSKGLFGVKSTMKLGPVDITSIASIERTKKDKQKFNAGSESQGQTVSDYNFRGNQYFFVDKTFRNGGVLLDDDGNILTGTTGVLSLPGFYPLKDGKHVIGNVVIDDIEIYKSVGAAAGSGTIYGLAYVEPIFSTETNKWSELDEEFSKDTEGSFFTRLIRNQDYIVSEDLGYIRMTTPVQNEILAISYTLKERGEEEPFKVIGELSSTVTEGDTINLKLIKPLTPNPRHPTWPLEFKNVYYLGARNINPDGLNLEITYKNGSLGNNVRDEKSGKTFLNLFGLDSLDANGNLSPDDLIDKMNPNILNLITGELFFPMLHPFEFLDKNLSNEFNEGNGSSELSDILPDSASLYRTINDQYIRNESQFDIKVEYQNKSATINLGGFTLVEGSEEVLLNNVMLVKDKDYVIDYFSGSLTLLTEAYNEPGADLEILFERNEIMSVDKKAMIGSRAQMDFGNDNRSFIGATALFYDQSVINEKVEVGYEPIRNFIWDINGKHSFELDGLTRAINSLPIVQTDQPSSIDIEGEIAQVLPNPNHINNKATGDTKGVSYIDDFEGSKRTTHLPIRRRFWSKSSLPLDKNPLLRSNLFWYNPWTQVVTQDIWPNQQTSLRAQNQLTDILVLNYSRRDYHNENFINPDSSWASITSSLYSSDYNQTQSKFFEIWLLTDPNTESKMTVDLGFISEDQNGNGVFDTEDKPVGGLLTGNTLLEDEEDIGLDGCGDEYEDGYGGCLDGITYEQALVNPFFEDLIYSGNDLNQSDPNNDNWSFSESSSEGSEKYKNINGTEGNGTSDRPLEGARYPDTEDINRDGNFDSKNDYFTSTFDLNEFSTDWEKYNAGYNITNMGKWRLYRIPLNEFKKARENGSITWDTIKFIRLTLSGSSYEDNVKIAKAEIVANQWQELGVKEKNSFTYNESDTSFAVTVINTEDNIEYARSVQEIGVQGEYDQLNGIQLKEQSLVLKFDELLPGSEGAAQKNIMELKGERAQSYLMYEKMKMFIYGNSDYINEESSDLEFFIKFGRSNDYYEIRYPIYSGWDKERKRNNLDLDLNFLTSLKKKNEDFKKFSDSDIFKITDSSRVYVQFDENSNDSLRTYAIYGDPALSRIQYFIVGVKNKNNLEPISGEIWLDELRLSQVRKDAGNAMRVQSRIGIADIASSTISYSRKNGDFHVLQERLGTGNTEGKFRADTRFQLHKFFPTRWGIKVPVNFSYSQNVSTPKYLPGTDIRLFHQEAPDSVVNKGDQFNFNTSFSKGNRSENWLARYTIDRIKFNFSTGRSKSSNVQIFERLNQTNIGGIGYNFNFGRDNFFTPFKNFSEIPVFGKKFSNTRVYYTPSTFDVNLKASEVINNNTPRIGESKSVYNLGLDRNFRLGYKILENLNSNYSKVMKSDLDHYRKNYLKAINKMDPGIVTDINENITTTFSPVIATWFRPNFNINSSYRWAKPIESTQEGARITSQGRFSTSLNLTPKAIVEIFYRPKSASITKRSRARGRSRTNNNSEVNSNENKQNENQRVRDPRTKKIFEFLHSTSTRINPISLTFGNNRTQNGFGVLGSPSLKYRLGLENKHNLNYSDEVGVNTGSTQSQKDYSVRSGVALTRLINTSFGFSRNKSTNIDGSQIKTETETSDFFPVGTMGDEGFAFPGWSIRFGGVEKFPFIKKIARSATIEHVFNGKQTKSWKNDDLQTSKYTSSFSPLAGISLSTKSGITISSRYAIVSTIDNRYGGINSTRFKKDNTLTASTNYAYRGGINIPLPFFRDFSFNNTINFTLTFDYSNSVTKERNDIQYDLSTTDIRKSWKLSPRISYTFGKNITGGIWYEYRESISKIIGRKVDRDFGFDVNVPIQG